MINVAIYTVLGLALFLLSFFAKRRFGLLGLALAAGSLLSGIWAFDAGLIASLLGFPSNRIVAAIVTSIIILLPAVVLLFHGYTYKTMIGRLIGAALFTALAMSLLITPLSTVFMPKGAELTIYNKLYAAKDMIIGVGLIIAVVDIALTRPADNSKKRR